MSQVQILPPRLSSKKRNQLPVTRNQRTTVLVTGLWFLVTFFVEKAPVAQQEEQQPSKLLVGRSTRPGRAFFEDARAESTGSTTEPGIPAASLGEAKRAGVGEEVP